MRRTSLRGPALAISMMLLVAVTAATTGVNAATQQALDSGVLVPEILLIQQKVWNEATGSSSVSSFSLTIRERTQLTGSPGLFIDAARGDSPIPSPGAKLTRKSSDAFPGVVPSRKPFDRDGESGVTTAESGARLLPVSLERVASKLRTNQGSHSELVEESPAAAVQPAATQLEECT
jgi:hypothetical protein